MKRHLLHTAIVAVLTTMVTFPVFGQGTAFTYQGVLTDGDQPASGQYDFRAQIYNRAVAGEPGDALVSGTETLLAVPVTNGAFVLQLDFGAGPFNGEDRWLALLVRTNAAPNFTVLLPRQKITPTPYSILSGRLAGNVLATQVSGTLLSSSLPTGGNWELDSTLTLDASTLAIDPANNRVGIGTPSPLWPLHIVGSQAVARLDSTGSTFGAVLELRNNTVPSTYLGAINFNNSSNTFPGQIGYLSTHDLIFRTDSTEQMRLSKTGRLDVPSDNSHVSLNMVDSILGIPFPRGIKVVADGPLSTAIAGHSASGTAGFFNNTTIIQANSTISKPHLRLSELEDGDFARLEFQAAGHAPWHIAVGGGAANQMNFYNATNGDVMTLSQAGTLSVKVLTITGGADVAEPFKVSGSRLPEGSVVVIDEENSGHLKLASSAYDRRVAGVISGAGGVNPGLSLQQQGTMEGDQLVALSGRVFVQADATFGAIKPGDLLTTSATPGHAMRVGDHSRAQGAVLGKAMTPLGEGKGLVLVLVTLQ